LTYSGSLKDELFLPGTTYRLFVYTLDSSVSSLTPNELTGGPFTSSASSPQFHLFPSQDGELYYIWLGGNAPNSSHTHGIYRSSDNDLICSEGSVTIMAERQAQVTADDHVEILFGGTVHERCPLPRGECQVTPYPGVFSEAVVGGPAAQASTTLVFTIRNAGNNCFTVQSISNVAPFSVTSTSQPLPADLNPLDSMTVEVTFTPSSIGSFGPVSLPIITNPILGDCTLECVGTARAPVASLSISPGNIGFGIWPVNGPPTTRSITIANTGELPLSVSIPSSTPGSAISWPAYSDPFPYGASHTITVTFNPTAETNYNATLTINSTAPSSPDNVFISGRGCTMLFII
jgi:hypothetical protein